MSIAEKIRQFYRHADISTKLTVTYAACFILLLIITNTVMYLGVFQALYKPADRTIRHSMNTFHDYLVRKNPNPRKFDISTMHKLLVSGVVMRAVDSSGDVFFSTDSHYPAHEIFEVGRLTYRPFLANDDMDISEIHGALIYRSEMHYFYASERYTFYFFRTITSQKNLLDNLRIFLITVGVFGIIFSVAFGISMNRKVLRPIKTMTTRAKEIAFGKMGERIEIPPNNDELAELAGTFNEMLDRIQGGIEQQQKFILDASHELINPAQAILSSAEFLKRYGADDKEAFGENVEIILAEVKNLDSVLQNLLFLARADQNRQKLNKEMLELSNIVEYAVDVTRVVAPNYRIELAENDNATIFADDDMIRQLLKIFLDNAVKFTPDGGTITVSSTNTGGEITLSIADTGIGIAPENLDRIFDKFFKVGGRDSDGSGLGLVIARWIANQHGIKISVASELGRGSTFTLKIPAVSLS